MIVDILRWAASLLGIVAAITVSLNAGQKITGGGFVIFAVSSLCWIIAALLGDRDPLLLQNLALFAINLFGVYRYLYNKKKG